jgi:hypothetical protein
MTLGTKTDADHFRTLTDRIRMHAIGCRWFDVLRLTRIWICGSTTKARYR